MVLIKKSVVAYLAEEVAVVRTDMVIAVAVAVFFGFPRCSSKEAISILDDDLFGVWAHVSLSPTILQQTKELQDLLYSFDKDYATAIANKYDDLKNIVNIYGYELKTKSALLAYYDILEFEDDYVSLFTTEEVLAIENLTNNSDAE